MDLLVRASLCVDHLSYRTQHGKPSLMVSCSSRSHNTIFISTYLILRMYSLPFRAIVLDVATATAFPIFRPWAVCWCFLCGFFRWSSALILHSRLLEDKEGFVLYTVLILKKFKDSFVADARAKKFNVREFVYNPEAAGSGLAKLHKMEHELQESLVRVLFASFYVFVCWVGILGVCISVTVATARLRKWRCHERGMQAWRVPMHVFVSVRYCVLHIVRWRLGP